MSAELRAKVAGSRAQQGLPPTVEDPAALERAASVLRLVECNVVGDGMPLRNVPAGENSGGSAA